MAREVIIKFEAYKEMVSFLSKFSSNKIPKEEWAESLGYLFCYIEGDNYIVEGAKGLGRGNEYSVHPSLMANAKYDEWMSEYQGCITGGWWHTHPGLNLFYSEWDVKNHVGWQEQNPDYLGIVFDHTIIDKDFLGFKIFRMLHVFSDEVVEVDYQLQGFTKEGLKDTLEILDIDPEIIDSLADKFGGKGLAPFLDFSKLAEPFVDDPLEDSEWIASEGDDLLKSGDNIGAIKKFKTAAIILENSEHYLEFAAILIKLIVLCAENQYFENVKEELKLFENIKSKINASDYEQDLQRINSLLENH